MMWKAYVDKGVAIQTNFERMRASFGRTPLAVIGDVVSYVNFERDQTGFSQVSTHSTTKDLHYEDEGEFRLLLGGHDPANVTLSTTRGDALSAVDVRLLIKKSREELVSTQVTSNPERRLEERGIPFQFKAGLIMVSDLSQSRRAWLAGKSSNWAVFSVGPAFIRKVIRKELSI